MKNKLVRGLAIGGAAFAVAWIFSLTNVLRQLEWKSWDARLALLENPARASRDIVLLTIDQLSLDTYEKQSVSWPWPRQMYSAVVRYLAAGKARVVFFDLILSEPSVYGEEDDADLVRALAESGRVFLPIFLRQAKEEEPAASPQLRRFAVPNYGWPKKAVLKVGSASLPLEDLLNASRGAGNVQFAADGDGIYRRMRLAFDYKGLTLPALPLALALEVDDRTRPERIPLDETGQMVIRYHGGSETYKRYSIAAIINSWAQIEEGKSPQIPPSEFAGKIVLVGGSAPGLLDLRPSPLNPRSPGTEIQAASLDTLLRRDFVRFPAAGVSLLLFLAFCLFTGLGVTYLKRTWQIVLFFALCLALPAAASALAYVAGFWLSFIVPELGVTVGFIGASVLNYSIEGRQRRFLKSAFRFYLSPQVIEQVLSDPSRLRLGGERREITSFFSDVAGFTSISEDLKPEELVTLLNAYLSEMTDLILDTGGTLDKYEGDAIVAFWNAPLDQPDHALRACRAALGCQKRLAELRSEFRRRFGKDLAMRIGLNSGPAVVGNMGSGQRFDYTAVGDTVNLASRLEGACKQYGVPILVGEETFLRIRDVIVGREVDTIRVVGKSRPVRVFEILGEQTEVAEDLRRRLSVFHQALEDYKRRNWEDALAAFQAAADDPLAGLYALRCRDLIARPPADDWDGVFELKQK